MLSVTISQEQSDRGRFRLARQISQILAGCVQVQAHLSAGCQYFKQSVRLSVRCVPMTIARSHFRLRELYVADFLKLGAHRSGRSGANSWCLFRCTPSQVGRGRRSLWFRWPCGEISLFCASFLFLRTHGLRHVRGVLASFRTWVSKGLQLLLVPRFINDTNKIRAVLPTV